MSKKRNKLVVVKVESKSFKVLELRSRFQACFLVRTSIKLAASVKCIHVCHGVPKYRAYGLVCKGEAFSAKGTDVSWS